MLIQLTTIFFKNSTLNSVVGGIAMCNTSLEGRSLEVISLEGRSQSFKGGRALDCFNRLFECSIRVFQIFKFSLAGNLRGFPETPLSTPLYLYVSWNLH